MIYGASRDEVAARLAAGLAPDLAGRAMALLRPTIGLKPGGSSAGLTRLGGRPNLPADAPWPSRMAAGRKPSWLQRLLGAQPMAAAPAALPFVAQVALDEVPVEHLDIPLPPSGLLLFFYDQNADAWGFSPEDKAAWKVLYAERPGPERAFPADLPDAERYPATPLAAETGWVGPPYECALPPGLELGADERNALAELTEDDNPPDVRLGGWANPIQGDVESSAQLASNGIDCGGPEGYERGRHLLADAWKWKLLLEVGSVDEAGMMWGDVGALYFQMLESDLRNRSWDKAWMEFQCC